MSLMTETQHEVSLGALPRVNLLPVGGLLLAPEASSGCSCNFSVQTSLALIPVRKK